jgi:hypothetical protein
LCLAFGFLSSFLPPPPPPPPTLETKRGDVTLRESYVSGRVRTAGGEVQIEGVDGAVEGSTQDGKVIKRRVSVN